MFNVSFFISGHVRISKPIHHTISSDQHLVSMDDETEWYLTEGLTDVSFSVKGRENRSTSVSRTRVVTLRSPLLQSVDCLFLQFFVYTDIRKVVDNWPTVIVPIETFGLQLLPVRIKTQGSVNTLRSENEKR